MNSDKHLLELKKPWDKNSNTAWLASSFLLRRNLEKFLFPSKLTSDRQKQIVEVVSKELLELKGLDHPFLLRAEEMSPNEKGYLFEHFLSDQTFQQAHSGEAFVIDQSGEFLAAINLTDHLQIQLLDCKGELENTLNRLIEIDIHLSKLLSFAYSPKFGYLTADPAKSGTGLVVTLYLQLPALIHLELLDEMLDKYVDDTVDIQGIQGNPTEIIGDVLAIDNHYTIGFTEENIVSNLRSIATRLQIEENSAKQVLKKTDHPEVKDKVARAYGILLHSYQIEAIEALNALSLLKLGVELDWVSGITVEEVNQLFFNCRRGHLLCLTGQPALKQEEILHTRTEFIHKALKTVSLKF